MRSALSRHVLVVVALLAALVLSLVWAPSSMAAPAATAPATAAPDAGSAAPPVAAPRQAAPPAAPAPSGPADLTSGLGCSSCHTTNGWKTEGSAASGEGGFDHSKTGFPLTGLHINVACVSCHLPKRPTPSRECSACHADFHRGRLSQSCDRCHSAAGWKVTRPLEIHRLTRFPLTGMHALADCNECHRRAADHQWSGTPVQCFGCHDKEYFRPDLRPPHQGAGVLEPFSRDCSICHRAIAWVPAFVRPTATGIAPGALRAESVPPPRHDVRFPISFGPHRTAACADCHASEKVPQAIRCTGCHAHEPLTLSRIHKQPVSMLGGSCLGCHPGGARR
jgi:hypothetical protein